MEGEFFIPVPYHKLLPNKNLVHFLRHRCADSDCATQSRKRDISKPEHVGD